MGLLKITGNSNLKDKNLSYHEWQISDTLKFQS